MSTSQTRMSPGLARSTPACRARIFSIIVMPMADNPVLYVARDCTLHVPTETPPLMRHSIGICMLLAVFAAGAHAQEYPVKPVRVIVPLPPGSTGEALARLVG